MTDAQILLTTAASVAFAHTILGPDHYLVFVAMAKARGWSLARTLKVTAVCGVGHVLSSVVLGAAGILLGTELGKLVSIESGRGELAGWALIAFGAVYLAWGLKKIGRGHEHAHMHRHCDIVHSHPHSHTGDHAHVHESAGGTGITPWAIFIIFVLGPCEALIPLFMYPAATSSQSLVMAVALVFGIVTILTMLLAVTVALVGLGRIRLTGLERYAHAIAGAAILACGSAISFMGL